MASGSYAYRARQIAMRQQGAPFAGTQPSRVLAIVHQSFWLKPWMLYPIGATCVLTVLLSTGIVSQHPVSSSSIVTFGGQTYDIQVGGDMASTWQQDHPASIPTPTQEPMASSTRQPSATPYRVVASPSIEVAFINQVLSTYHSPAEGSSQALYDLGVQYGIDPVFALAFFMHESSFGTQGEATKSLSLGNLRCIPNYRCEDNFAQFDSWEEGFKAWYQLIRNFYVAQWGLTTVDQIIPRYAPEGDHNDEAAYIAALKHAIDTWHGRQIVVS